MNYKRWFQVSVDIYKYSSYQILHIYKSKYRLSVNLLWITAQEFGIETEVVQADFMNGRPIYEDIAKHLQDKEIGILGKWIYYFS